MRKPGVIVRVDQSILPQDSCSLLCLACPACPVCPVCPVCLASCKVWLWCSLHSPLWDLLPTCHLDPAWDVSPMCHRTCEPRAGLWRHQLSPRPLSSLAFQGSFPVAQSLS